MVETRYTILLSMRWAQDRVAEARSVGDADAAAEWQEKADAFGERLMNY